MDIQTPPAHGTIYEEDPNRSGLHAVMEGEDAHHEKKPVLKKVKDKVKKIKDTISKKLPGHEESHADQNVEEDDEGYDEDDEDERKPDPAVHGVYGITGVEEDTAAPKDISEGGEEIGICPVIIHSIEVMTISDIPEPCRGSENPQPGPEEKPQKEEEGEPAKEKEQSYTEKEAAVVGSSEYGKKVASTVYEKVAEAGTAVIGKVQRGSSEREGEGKRVAVKESLGEKLRPEEEDRALCEVISEMIHKRKVAEEEEQKMEEVTGSGEGSSGTGVIGRIRGAVTSLFGGSGGSHASPRSDDVQPKEASEGTHDKAESEKLREGID